MAKFDPIKNAIILDTETMGIGLGSPIHEVSVYNINDRAGYQFLMQPNFVVKTGETHVVDSKRMTSSGKDFLASFFQIGFESKLRPGSGPAISPKDLERLEFLKKQDLTGKPELQRAVRILEGKDIEFKSFDDMTPDLQRQIRRSVVATGQDRKEKRTLTALFKQASGKDQARRITNLTTLKQAAERAGHSITWGDTIVAKAILTAEMEAIPKNLRDSQSLEAARTKTLQIMEEIIEKGGASQVLQGGASLEAGGTTITKRQLLENLKRTDPFLYDTVIGPLSGDSGTGGNRALRRVVYPHLSKIFDQRIDAEDIATKFQNPNLKNLESLYVASGQDVTMERLLTGKPITAQMIARGNPLVQHAQLNFGELLRNNAIWIANANFESKMFGSQMMAMEAQFDKEGRYLKSLYSQFRRDKTINKAEFIELLKKGVDEGRFSNLRTLVVGGTSPYTADAFTISNPKIAEARAKALSDDRRFAGYNFTTVFQAYRKHMRAGDVGDIIDIVKAHQAYIMKLGPQSTNIQKPLTLSMDISFRLYRAAEVAASLPGGIKDASSQDKILKALFEAESHIALEDATKTEAYVLQKSYTMSSFYHDNLKHLVRGKSAIYDHRSLGSTAREAKYFHYLLDRVAPEVQKMQFEKRLISAVKDLNETGYSIQTTGKRRLGTLERLVPIFDDLGNFTDFRIEKVTTSYLDRTEGKVTLNSLEDVITHIMGDVTSGRGEVDANYKPIVSSLRDQYMRTHGTDTTDHKLLANYINNVISKLSDAETGIGFSSTQGGDVRTLGAQGTSVDLQMVSDYETRLSHSTNEIIANAMQIEQQELKEVERNVAKMATSSAPEVIEEPLLSKAVQGELAKMFSQSVDLEYDRVLAEIPLRPLGTPDQLLEARAASAINEDFLYRAGKKTLFGMAAIGAVGAAASFLTDGQAAQKEGITSLRTQNYQNWLDTQKRFYGMHNEKSFEGMSHNGILSSMRRLQTDFGSPYKGPEYSNLVFQHQDLLDQRENYLRSNFGIRHYTSEGDIGRIFEKIRLSSIFSNIASNAPVYDNYNFGQGVEGNFTLAGVKRDVNLVKLNLENYRIQVEDADTITLHRRGPQNGLSNFFGMNEKPISIRLAGIDAPETAKRGKMGQPFSKEATGALRSMLSRSNVSIYVDRKNITYGRQVGHVFADDKNLSLELIRRGYASYLPYRGKGVKQSYEDKVYRSASKLSQGNDYGMWGNPYFQAYRDVVSGSGKSVTFNTLVNVDKVAQNSNLMSMYSLMNTAREMGMYNTSMQVEAAAIGDRISQTGLRKDYKDVILFGSGAAPHKSYQTEMLNDLSKLVRTKGGRVSNKASVKSVSNLNKSMAIDSTGVTNSIYNKRRYNAEAIYGVDYQRRRRLRESMAYRQKEALRQMKAGPIGHHRM